MALTEKQAPRQYGVRVASGVGTSQEGEAMTVLLYVPQLEPQEGVYWVVPDLESAVAALRTYKDYGYYGDGIHRLYACTLGAERQAPRAVINIVVMPLHRIIAINTHVDGVT